MPTPEQIEQALYEAEVAARLRERARAQLAGQTQVLQLLAEARAQIMAALAELPADWQQWQLSRLLGQINDVLDAATTHAGTVFGSSMAEAWRMGEDLVDKPLAAMGQPVEMRLAQLDVGLLRQMSRFGALRLKDVGVEASRLIGQQLGLVTIGAQTPFAAIKATNAALGGQAMRRATTIVRTETARAFAVASHQRLVQAAQLVPGMGKRWRRSGKIHSRWSHDLMDGQVVADPSQPFKVPNERGGMDLMQHPHDPKAPPEQVINCGCVCLGWKAGWKLATPGAKPYSEDELRLNGTKAALDRDAKKAGRRVEVMPELPNADKALIPTAKLAGYALNADHPVGGHKARVLASALGYTAENADDLARQLLAGIKGRQATSALLDTHGQRWEVDVPVTGPKGSGTVRTGWIVRPGETAPQLISAYLAKERKTT